MRITEPGHVRHILRIIGPYLTTGREAARQALTAMNQIAAKQNARDHRDREIVALWLDGRSRNSIAKAVGVPFGTVSKVIARFDQGPTSPGETLMERRDGRPAPRWA